MRDDLNAVETALAVLNENGFDIASARDGDLDDLEQERFNAVADACRAYAGALAHPPVPDDVAGRIVRLAELYEAAEKDSIHTADRVAFRERAFGVRAALREFAASRPLATASTGEREDYVLRKGGYFYRPGWAGYTVSIHEVGRYTGSEAHAHAANTEGVTAHHESEFLSASPPAEEAGKVEAEPVAWLTEWQFKNSDPEWVKHPGGGSTLTTHAEEAAKSLSHKQSWDRVDWVRQTPLYSAATVAKLTEERDGAQFFAEAGKVEASCCIEDIAIGGEPCDAFSDLQKERDELAATVAKLTEERDGAQFFADQYQQLKDKAIEVGHRTESRLSALERDTARVVEAGQFLLDRLGDFGIPDEEARGWIGHVEPAVARFRGTIDAALGEMGE